jgi:enamine deaminase RidA (YjgF/YER057c/UK114 family)
MAKQVIEPEGLPRPPLHYSSAIRVDDWVFVSGQLASDFKSALAPAATVANVMPFHGSPIKRQSRYLFANMELLLRSAGSSLNEIVRIDQFTSARESVHPYLEVRNEILTTARPASTAVQVESLMVSDAIIEADAIAIVPRDGFRKAPLSTDKVQQPPAGYSLAISAGGFIFASGATPTDYRSGSAWVCGPGTGLAEEARIDPNFWFGSEIKTQTAYVVKKLAIYLEAGGAALRDIVKAQVYLARMDDHFAFQEAWQVAFNGQLPATTIVPVKGMSTAGGRVEINVVATARAQKLPRQTIEVSRAPKPLNGEPQAVRLGNLLFLSGLMACTESGPCPEITQDPGLRYVRSKARQQMEIILRNAQYICEAAGTTLDNIVRAQLFYSDLADIRPSFEVWKEAFPLTPPAATMVQVHDTLSVPACTILADFVAWIPN